MEMDRPFKWNWCTVFLIWVVRVTSSYGMTSPNEADTTIKLALQEGTQTLPDGHKDNLPLFTVNYTAVQIPFEITLWVLLASFAKIGFNVYDRITVWIPEPCLLIGVGLIMGGIMHSVKEKPPPVLTSSIFILYMLPPIILDSGYFMPSRPFFENVGTVLWFAVVGTLWNSIGIGLSLYAVCCIDAFGVKDISLQENLLFATIISAVDPVAVLSIFEDININEQLYIVMFGECLFSDAVTVVLYDMFTFMADMPEVKSVDVFLGAARFFIVGVGGLLLGFLFGFVAAFTTRFTSKVREMEPLLAFTYSYLAYLVAELFAVSSIMAIVTCALIMKYYVEENVAQNSCTTIRHVVKMLASLSETLIFLFLGVVTVTTEHEWDWGYIAFALLFASIWRVLGVLVLIQIINPFRTIGFSYKDQFGLAYGGLRGAVSFALVFILPQSIARRKLFLTATITIIIFTVFIQGISMRPLIELVNVRKTRQKLETTNVEIHVRVMEHAVAGIEDLCGQWSHHYWKDKFKKFNDRFIRWILVKDSQAESSIVALYKKLELQSAIEILDPPAYGDIGASLSLGPQNGVEKRASSQMQTKFLASDLGNIHRLLLKIRQRTVSYRSKHALPDESRTREILIRRHASLRCSLRGGGSQPQNVARTQNYFPPPTKRTRDSTFAPRKLRCARAHETEVELDYPLASPTSTLLLPSSSCTIPSLGTLREAPASISMVKDYGGCLGNRRVPCLGSTKHRLPGPWPASQLHLEDPVNKGGNGMEASDNGTQSLLL